MCSFVVDDNKKRITSILRTKKAQPGTISSICRNQFQQTVFKCWKCAITVNLMLCFSFRDFHIREKKEENQDISQNIFFYRSNTFIQAWNNIVG